MNDLRFSLRQLAKSPGFTVVAVLTLGLGIGASSAVFSVVETFLLRPLPYRAAEQLVDVQCQQPGLSRLNVTASVPEFEDLRDRAGVFAELSMVFPMNGNLTGVAQPQRVEAMAVSPNFFRLLAVAPALGRTFGEEEAAVTGWAEGCVLSYAAWQRCFGGDPAALGRKFALDYDTYRVVGVMPRDFRHPGRTLSTEVDVWFTGGMRTAPFPAVPQRSKHNIPGMIGRLKSGMSLGEAQARLDGFAAELRQHYPKEYPAEGRWTTRVQPLQQQLVGDVRPVLWVLFGAVTLVLLICCATLANLLLVRAAGRRQELAVRVALGASHGAIVRQLCIESLVLALAGGLLGLLLAASLPPLIVALAPVSLPRVNELAVNLNVLAFTLAVSGLTAFLFGLVPAWQATKFDLVTSLKDGARSTSGAMQRTRTWFAAGQVALSVVLLAGGGLLLRSFWRALQVEAGFDARRVTVARVWMPPPTDPNARQSYRHPAYRVTFMREVLRRLRTLPGVEHAAVGTGPCIPLGGDWARQTFSVEGETTTPGVAPTALAASVSPDYFATLGLRLVRGVGFSEADDGENRVVLVNTLAAARFWPNGNPVGRRIAIGGSASPQWWTVVGVVGQIKAEGLDLPDAPQLFFPVYQRSSMGLTLFLKMAGDGAPPAEAIRREISAIDPDLPVFGVRPLTDVAAASLAPRRFAVVVVGAFAAVALALAGLGVYGVVALTVSQRTREIGVRMALGAERRQVFALVLRHGLRMTAIGVAVGLAGAFAMTGVMRGLLFDTSPFDPVTLGSIVALLAVVALAACWLPARRAARVDPMTALRSE